MSFNWGFNCIFISYLFKWIIWINSTRWEFIFREFVYLHRDMGWPPSTLHLVHCYIWFWTKKLVVRGGGIDYLEFDSKVSYKMFLHDNNLLACEIFTVRPLALRQTKIHKIYVYNCHATLSSEILSSYKQVNVNDCAVNPCLHGGTCTDLVAGFSCNCTDGWTGQTCGQLVEKCDASSCSNQAACLNTFNSIFCRYQHAVLNPL